MVFKEHTLQCNCKEKVWLWNLSLWINTDLSSLPVLNANILVTGVSCIFLWSSPGSGVQKQQRVPSCPLTGAARRGHRLTAHPLGCAAPGHPPHPAPGPGCSRTHRVPLPPPPPPPLSQPALRLTRPDYWRIRLKTPVFGHTILEPP